MIHYIKGDATNPIDTNGVRIIAHVCNNCGGWGAGFVTALSKKWRAPESRYRRWFREQAGFELGAIQLVLVEDEPHLVWVANMIAQVGYGRRGSALHKQLTEEEPKQPPLRYDALRKCLVQVADQAKKREASIHAPRLGAGLAGGKWSEIERILIETTEGLQVYVYDPPSQFVSVHF